VILPVKPVKPSSRAATRTHLAPKGLVPARGNTYQAVYHPFFPRDKAWNAENVETRRRESEEEAQRRGGWGKMDLPLIPASLVEKGRADNVEVLNLPDGDCIFFT